MAPLTRRVIIVVISAIVSLGLFYHYHSPSHASLLTPTPPKAEPEPLFDLDNLPSFKWRDLPEQNPVDPASMLLLPTGPEGDIPQIQYDFKPSSESATHRKERQRRLLAVKEAFKHSWNGYKKNAWLHDEVKPIAGKPADPFGGWGATLVDTLDTLWIMGLEAEFEEAVAALEQIDFSRAAVKEINVFETTIRYLGGFISAYDLSDMKYPLLLQKAEEVAELLYRAFDTPNRMPITRWDWAKYLQNKPQLAPKNEVVAELGSLTLEFTRLSQITGNPKWYDAVQRISDAFAAEQSKTLLPGLWPLTVNSLTLNFHEDVRFTVGGMADSVFEYLSKEYILLAGRSAQYATMHNAMVQTVKSFLLFEPLLPPSSIKVEDQVLSPLFLGSIKVDRTKHTRSLDPQGEHLTCFAGGMLALGARALRSSLPDVKYQEDMDVARRLTDGCIWSYFGTPTGIGPEIFHTSVCRAGRDAITRGVEPDSLGNHGDCTWDEDRWLQSLRKVPRNIDKQGDGRRQWAKDKKLLAGFTDVPEAKYILRPEAIESVFVLYRTTGDEALREHAWKMFQAIVRFTRTDIAFASLPDVMTTPNDNFDSNGKTGDAPNEGVRQMDSMESFWTAETLKYFYLLFEEPDVVSLDEFVFNTEAHPMRYRKGKGGRTRGSGG